MVDESEGYEASLLTEGHEKPIRDGTYSLIIIYGRIRWVRSAKVLFRSIGLKDRSTIGIGR